MKNDSVFLQHILDSISKIEKYTLSMDFEKFSSNSMAQDAVVRQIEIIGEAAKNLSDKIKSKEDDIPWRDIVGMRDKLIHHYFGTDSNSVWKTVEEDIPKLKESVNKILDAEKLRGNLK